MRPTTDTWQRTRFIILSSVVLFVCYPLPATHAAGFDRDLSLGASGDDVRALQVILNSRVDTQIAAFGPGSPGQETDYFGEKTRAAVVRYQNLHKNEVLTPAGLSAGTGYVGALTRAKLSASVLNVSQGFAGLEPSNGTSAASFGALAGFGSVSATGFVFPSNTESLADGVKITSISPTSGPEGTKVTIYGEGFAESNTVLGATMEPAVVKPSKDGSLTIEIENPFPKDLPGFFTAAMKEFSYVIYIENENGHSNPVKFMLTFE